MFSANASQVSNDVKYIEDFCSVYLRTGTGASQTVTTGVKENTGALVISKSRSAATDWAWYDTFRGATYDLVSNSTAAQTTQSQGLTAFNADGHTWGTLAKINTSGATYVDTVLKPTPKFFDVVTWSGDGTGNGRRLAHNLGSVPGCMIFKRTNLTGNWGVWHRTFSNPTDDYLNLNLTNAVASFSNTWGTSAPTDTDFPVGSSNTAGQEFVAYLFAHDAGGFGLTGTDNVISCGSYTGDGNSFTPITLGFEPQWLMIKRTDGVGNWAMFDTTRGMPTFDSSGAAYGQILKPNLSLQETGGGNGTPYPVSTGFGQHYADGDFTTGNFIYIAIRRGPMKVPTSGTSVLQTLTYTGNGSSGRIYSGVTTVPDLAIATSRSNTSPKNWCDRLRGENPMISTSTDGESGTSQEGKTIIAGSANGTVTFGSYWGDAAVNTNGYTYVNYLLSRAPSFFDEVCYTGTGSNTTQTHNLGVVPELIIVKRRDTTGAWDTYSAALSNTEYLVVNTTAAKATGATRWNSTTPTSTVFSLGTSTTTNASGGTYVAYLFATCAGVSKVGSYTGTGTTKQVDCGFTGGARFVLIKRTDSTGDWYVWDSARGIVSGDDPYLLLNSTAAEVTNTDYVDTYSAGFEISSTAPAAINASGGTFIFLAIA